MVQSTTTGGDIYDVIIVGAGAVGAALAWNLSAGGYRVCVCDEQPAFPQLFRAEQASHRVVESFRELGVFAKAEPALTPMDYTAHFRNGHMSRPTTEEDYAMYYWKLVESLREGLDKATTLHWERVVRVSTGGRVKSVRLESGKVICGWLIVVASGGARDLQRTLGLHREVLWKHHSSTYAWNLELAEPARMNYPALVFQTSRPEHGYAYLVIFRVRDEVRANFFTYWKPGGERSRALTRGDSKAVLGDTVEGLFEYLGDFEISSPVQAGIVSLTRVHGGLDAGVIRGGDAGGRVAPPTGLGLYRGLNDLRVLVDHIPGWLEGREVSRQQMEAYYEDPRKTGFDEHAYAKCIYDRRLAVDRSPAWVARRLKGEYLPGWLEEACIRGYRGGRWTVEHVGIPAWRKGAELVRARWPKRDGEAQLESREGDEDREPAGHARGRSGRVLAPRHDDLSRSDGLDNLIS